MSNEQNKNHSKGVRKTFSKQEREKILEKTGCKCGHCGMTLNEDNMTVDHVFPVHKGGQNDEYNLVALCEKCNQEKSNWVYKVTEYYKYILPEYMDNFFEYNVREACKYKKNQLIKYDAVTYTIVPNQYKKILVNMVRRGKNSRDKLLDTIHKTSMKLILSKAYEGDAEDIFKLITYSKDKISILNTDLYTNVYEVRNDIRFGEAYVLKKNNKVCGAFIFRKVEELNIDLDYVQLNNIEDSTNLRKKYIMTLACLNYFAAELLSEIMEDMYNSMISNGAIPLYYNILSSLYRKKSDIICMPTKLDGVEGHIEFMHLKAIKQHIIEDIKDIVDYRNIDNKEKYTDEYIENIVDKMLEDSDEDDKDLEDIRKLLFNEVKFKNFDEETK